MSVLATSSPTLVDLAKRLDPDGKIAMIAELLNQTNEVLTDMPWVEGNLPTGHRTTVRTGIPAPTWLKLYQGVQPSKSTTVQVTDNCGMLENYSKIDKDLAELNGNAAAFRLTEDSAIIEGFSQTLASTIFYGNEGTEPAAFTGLSARYNTRSAAVSPSADNVIHAGGAGSDNTSIWLIVWGPRTIHGIYPKGSKAGLDMQDKGQQTIQEADGSMWEALISHYQWKPGLSVRDWRFAARIANIDLSDLTKDASSGADLVDLMKQATHKIPSLKMGTAAFYCNRDIMSMLDRQQGNYKNVNLSVKDLGGQETLMCGRVPVRRCDALLNTEAVVPNS
jgi:hypothetical protein